MANVGRPSDYTQEKADIICTQIASSCKSLRTICLSEDLPTVTTVLNWLREKPEFLVQYTRAKEEQADFLAEEIIEISDDGSKDDTPFTGSNHVQRSRLKVESRKWIASKLKPKKYGDKVTTEITGADGGPVQITGMEIK